VADILFKGGAHYYIQKCDYVKLTQTLQALFDLLIKDTKQPTRNKFVLSLKEIHLKH
jgi:hypothetical protein